MINFFKNLFGFGLKGKLMKIINQRIAEVEKAYNSELDTLKKDAYARKLKLLDGLREDLDTLSSSVKVEKEAIATRHINSVISKIL